jgi:MFS-type transporter involved in bile tolerance (Atg22 family)
MTLVALTAPIFGAVADFSRGKKRNDALPDCYLTVIITRGSSYQPGAIFLVAVVFLAHYGFTSAMCFYDAFLPENPTNLRISARLVEWAGLGLCRWFVYAFGGPGIR